MGKYLVTEKGAKGKLYGRRRKVGEPIELTDRQAEYELSLGTITAKALSKAAVKTSGA